MLNLFYEESYWGGASRMNGPQKVVKNLIASLEQENIPYAINEEKYKYNFLKAVLRYGYILDGMRRKDENYTILQLKKSEKPIILSDLI